jgi:hypothetical protein
VFSINLTAIGRECSFRSPRRRYSAACSFVDRGGSSGAWGIKDLAQYSEEGESSHLKELAAAIGGGFAGYSVGYRAAMVGLPKCDSPQLLNSLQDPSKWVGGLEKDELKLTLAPAEAQAKNYKCQALEPA